MRQILVVGASGLAREVIRSAVATGIHEVVGVLDDNQGLLGKRFDGIPVVGSVLDAARRGEQLLVCIGAGASRERVVRRLIAAGVTHDRFATHVDASVRIPEGCLVGAGSILLQGVIMTASVTIAEHVVAMPSVVFTHDDQVAPFATLAAGVLLGGGAHIGRAAYLGMGSSVRQHVRIGDYATLGMGAVLIKDLPAHQTWAGVPASPLLDHHDHDQAGSVATMATPRHSEVGV